ncbi:MAG: hypothetical protein RQ826_01380 [Xanthomonadales bacterium]|nr:hypothetical protein [Xanthomonadales bacterium]
MQIAVVVLYLTTTLNKMMTVPKMLRLTRTRNQRVPNGLAMIAALLLIGSGLAGLKPAEERADAESRIAGQVENTAPESESAPRADVTSKTNKRRGFRMSFFLFRRY